MSVEDDFFNAARTDREREFLGLADLDDETVQKLAHVEEDPDPITDGLGCEDYAFTEDEYGDT